MRKEMIVLGLVFSFVFISGIGGCANGADKKIIFSFLIEETNEAIDGEALANGISLGLTHSGKIAVLKEDIGKISFKTDYANNTYLFEYNISAGDLANDKINLVVSSEDFNKNYLFIEDNFSKTEGMHWTHMPISYFIVNKKICGNYESNMIQKAFNEIENATKDIVYFKEINNTGADIKINCSFLENCYQHNIQVEHSGDLIITTTNESICAHDKGRAQITESSNNKILKANIEMIGLAGFAETNYEGMSGFAVGSCGYPETEIHEILHAFGFGHVNNSKSIMSPESEGVGYTLYRPGECLESINSIDEDIVNSLIADYS